MIKIGLHKKKKNKKSQKAKTKKNKKPEPEVFKSLLRIFLSFLKIWQEPLLYSATTTSDELSCCLLIKLAYVYRV